MFKRKAARISGCVLALCLACNAVCGNVELTARAAKTEESRKHEKKQKAKVQNRNRPESESKPESEAEPETESEPESETEAETESEPESETEPETESEPESETEAETESEPESETEPETESEPESETEPETESEPESETEPETESEPESETEPETESEPESETEPETESEPESETEEESEEKEKPKKPQSNAPTSDSSYSYTASENYYWDSSWYVKKDFRFSQVDAAPSLAGKREVYVYDGMSKDAQQVGIIPYFGIAYVLDEADAQWDYIESGDVRGFIRSEDLSQGEFPEKTVAEIGDDAFATGIMLCEKADNAAFTYTHTTVQEVLAPKEYAVCVSSGNIYEYTNDTARAVGTVSSGTVVCILADAGSGWQFVESGDVRGFIRTKELLSGTTAAALALDAGEENTLAVACMEPEENHSLYYTLRSTKEASERIGEQVAAFAAGFAGRLPYIWGGTSLTSGADCSGFTQAVFANFGVRIPRLAEEQGVSGEQVNSLADARPGDIIYWSGSPHVGIYLGNGQAAQCSGGSRNTAANPRKGVTISDVNYRPIRSIRRFLIETEDYCGVGGKRRDATHYTQEQLELIWAIVAQEDNGSYEGALAVISSAMNRTESPRWGSLGGNALMQLTAPGQYCYSMDRYWIPRLHGNVPDYVKTAVDDCLNKGIRNHAHTSFRSRKGSQTGADAVQIGGNWFFGA